MELSALIKAFSTGREKQQKAIFNTLFIAGNRLQTLFDSRVPGLSLKQFMLVSVLRQSKQQLTLTQLGGLLGCSRQNIKKLAVVLEKKGFVRLQQSTEDVRALSIVPTEKINVFFDTDFAKKQTELQFLFAPYTDEEVETLFRLLMKLYEGIDCLQNRISGEKEESV